MAKNFEHLYVAWTNGGFQFFMKLELSGVDQLREVLD